MHTLNRQYSRRHGFSLVEIALAIAIVATAILPIIALATSALGMGRDARDTSTSALIATELTGRIQQADQAQIASWVAGTNAEFYYDIDGQLLGQTSAEQATASFTGRIAFPSMTLEMNPPPPENPIATQALVLVSDAPANLGSTAITNALNPSSTTALKRAVRRYPVFVVNLEK